MKKFKLDRFFRMLVKYSQKICFVLLSQMNILNLNAQSDAFITTWKTDNLGSSDSKSIEIPTYGSGYYYDVDWNNDGVYDQFGITGIVQHAFSSPGVFTIRIIGSFPRIYFEGVGDCKKLISIDQWGTNIWQSMEAAFAGCENLIYYATDIPNLSDVLSMQSIFSMCINFNGDIGKWDISNVKNLSYAFYGASQFNANINDWNVSGVLDMEGLFARASVYNQPLDKWNVSNVTNMKMMFFTAEKFNQNIESWNVSRVRNFEGQFYNAESFDKPLRNWNVSAAETMGYMFVSTPFNQDISKWDVSNVTKMNSMFTFNSKFNQDIGSWNVSNVTYPYNEVHLADKFDLSRSS